MEVLVTPAPERWKVIPDTDHRYEVSTHGRVRNSETGRSLSVYPVDDTYAVVVLRVRGNNIRRHVANLVLNAFSPYPGPSWKRRRAVHADGVFMNCRLDNLSWGTHDNRRYKPVPLETARAIRAAFFSKRSTVTALRKEYGYGWYVLNRILLEKDDGSVAPG